MDQLATDFAPAGYTYIFLDGAQLPCKAVLPTCMGRALSQCCPWALMPHAALQILALIWDCLPADAWDLETRDKQGQLVPDPTRFGGGIASLATYAHQKGTPAQAAEACCLQDADSSCTQGSSWAYMLTLETRPVSATLAAMAWRHRMLSSLPSEPVPLAAMLGTGFIAGFTV